MINPDEFPSEPAADQPAALSAGQSGDQAEAIAQSSTELASTESDAIAAPQPDDLGSAMDTAPSDSPAQAMGTGGESAAGAGQPLNPGDTTESPDGLLAQTQALQSELAALERQRDAVRDELNQKQAAIATVLEDSLTLFKARQADLQRSIEQLERRREAVRKEMRENFAGVSQDLALRVQGFKDYLVGSLQDLASTADQLNLGVASRAVPLAPVASVAPGEAPGPSRSADENVALPLPQFAQKTDVEQEQAIREMLEQYRTAPDYYGPPWQLRRTFEPVHGARISQWFFDQGGRGSIKTLGSRLQNILVASAAVSVMNAFYGDRCCTLVLANSPERLGDWRRGLQECLGIARQDFGPNSGVVLCESPEVLAQRAERLLRNGDLPLIIIDESEVMIDVALLRFPLWLAFSPDPAQLRPSYDEPFGPERTDRREGGGLLERGNGLLQEAMGSLGLGRDNGRDARGDRYAPVGSDPYGASGGSGSGGYGSGGYGSGDYDAPGSGNYGDSRYDTGGYGSSGYGSSGYDSGGYDASRNQSRDYPPDRYAADPYPNDPYAAESYRGGGSNGADDATGGYGSGASSSGDYYDVPRQDNERYGDSEDRYGDRNAPPSRRSRYSRDRRDEPTAEDDWF